MSFYKVEEWTIRDVAKAFKERSGDDSHRKVTIPVFQRGLRWSKSQRNRFIDSISKGYPFGSLLFAQTNEINVFSVVDGLQRGSTVCDYIYNPLSNIERIDENTLDAIRRVLFPEAENKSINKVIGRLILDYYKEKQNFDNIDLFKLARTIFKEFPNLESEMEATEKIYDILSTEIKSVKDQYNKVCSAAVPIVVYSGPQELLCEIFNLINTEGIPLNDYEIYAAVWSQKKYKINCKEIVDKVINKYLVLLEKDFTLKDFSIEDIKITQELSAFEYLFGLGKYWNERYECLKVETTAKDDEINEISFEIVDACINDSDNVANLDKSLSKLNINKLQKRIEEAIQFVNDSIAVVSQFKGNKRKFNVLHSKYQIISLIANTFREMYDVQNLDTLRATWNDRKKSFDKLLLSHYVADIVGNYWHDGGGGKVYSSINEKRYLEVISKQRWESLIDNYYQSQLSNKQNERFTNPTNSDSVILNCIYMDLFTAKDQLSTKRFDIEHLATKEKMRLLLKDMDGLKLPVSCLANYCYLPEDVNRGKKEKTIYEATGLSYSVDVIEKKFSFTKESDFEWLYARYNKNDGLILETYYLDYLNKRFKTIREMFLKVFC